MFQGANISVHSKDFAIETDLKFKMAETLISASDAPYVFLIGHTLFKSCQFELMISSVLDEGDMQNVQWCGQV